MAVRRKHKNHAKICVWFPDCQLCIHCSFEWNLVCILEQTEPRTSLTVAVLDIQKKRYLEQQNLGGQKLKEKVVWIKCILSVYTIFSLYRFLHSILSMDYDTKYHRSKTGRVIHISKIDTLRKVNFYKLICQ